ncbi:unnamed protein product, partial [Mesorhabditis spiculigera]
MDFGKHKMNWAGNEVRRVRRTGPVDIKPEREAIKVSVQEEQPYNLQFYRKPPTTDISLEEFETTALQRFNLLKAITDIKESHKVYSDEFVKAMESLLSKEFPVGFSARRGEWNHLNRKDQRDWREKDLIGHYILRLAFAKTPEDRKWLINSEMELFRFRFKNETKELTKKFLRDNSIEVEPVSSTERQELSELLEAACAFIPGQVECTDFWKIKFTEASDLIRKRKCLLRAGTAYLPADDLQIIVTGIFRTMLSGSLARLYKHLPNLQDEADRILPLLERISKNAYSGKEYSGDNANGITRHMIDALSAEFPLCMRTIHQRLRADHHIKHGARQQYGLFLKAIGLPLDEAMAFMREEFTKKVDAEKFEKQYGYNIRHQYGKEGRRKDYPALSCQAIILGAPPSAGDCHGCPYKHTDPKGLQSRLISTGLTQEQVETIMTLVKGARYDKACTRQFEYARGMADGGLGTLITHPNQYYEMATQVRDGKRTEEHTQLMVSQSVDDSTQLELKHDVTAIPEDSMDIDY